MIHVSQITTPAQQAEFNARLRKHYAQRAGNADLASLIAEAIATMRDCADGAELKGLAAVPLRLREMADKLAREVGE